jgi:hypothetical protein
VKLSIKGGKRVYSLGGLLVPIHRTKLDIFPYVQKCTENPARFLECSRCEYSVERFACFCVLSQWTRNKKGGKSSGGLHAAAN